MALAAALVVAGLAGTLLPWLPGPPLVFAGLLVAAWSEDFVHVGPRALAGMGVLAAVAYVLDFVAGSVAAGRYGSSRRAMLGAAIGTLVGLFFGLPGLILGPFLGAVLGALSEDRSLERAGRAGFGAWVGMVLGVAAKIAILFAMIGWFLALRLL